MRTGRFRDSVYSAPLFTVGTRTTHTDVMCTTIKATITKAHDEQQQQNFRCKLPQRTLCDEEFLFPRKQRCVSFSQTLVDALSRQRMHAKFLAERKRFFGRLEADRARRLVDERRAATLIQAGARGRLARLSLGPASHKAELCDFESVLRRELMDLADNAGLAPIRGVTLRSARKRNKRTKQCRKKVIQDEKRQSAARILQGCARRRSAMIKAQSIRDKSKIDAKESSGVSRIQRYYRGHLARLDFLEKRSHTAAAKIQGKIRQRKADLKRARARDNTCRIDRERNAAERIQSTGRAILARKSFIDLIKETHPHLLEKKKTNNHHRSSFFDDEDPLDDKRGIKNICLEETNNQEDTAT